MRTISALNGYIDYLAPKLEPGYFMTAADIRGAKTELLQQCLNEMKERADHVQRAMLNMSRESLNNLPSGDTLDDTNTSIKLLYQMLSNARAVKQLLGLAQVRDSETCTSFHPIALRPLQTEGDIRVFVEENGRKKLAAGPVLEIGLQTAHKMNAPNTVDEYRKMFFRHDIEKQVLVDGATTLHIPVGLYCEEKRTYEKQQPPVTEEFNGRQLKVNKWAMGLQERAIIRLGWKVSHQKEVTINLIERLLQKSADRAIVLDLK